MRRERVALPGAASLLVEHTGDLRVVKLGGEQPNHLDDVLRCCGCRRVTAPATDDLSVRGGPTLPKHLDGVVVLLSA
jgi:hypothetical protein